MKDILTKKRTFEDVETIAFTAECSALLKNKSPPKLKDPGSFSIRCTIGTCTIDKALCDLGASVSVMSYSICDKLKIGVLKCTSVTLRMSDRSIKRPLGVLGDVPVKVYDEEICPVIVSAHLSESQLTSLLKVLKTHKKSIGYKLDDLKAISPEFYMHRICPEEDHKPCVKGQTRLNPNMQEMVKKKRCEEVDLVLNWEKCYFMVNEGVVLGHIVSERDIEVDRAKGGENVVADHLSRLKYDDGGINIPIDDSFADDALMMLEANIPRYADIANDLVGKELPPDLSYQQRKKFIHDAKLFLWDDPYLFKHCSDGLFRRFVPQ
ncbi:uncharacterized protein LOC141631102 [Silene latifolia]|uniref:uncharacterized protein LOC141631102 n=1 Tax=Silene latifolia TaxID=37657 RepID=UPI003D77940F